MIKKKFLLIFTCLVFCFNLVYALNEVSYPVTELGNCESQKACAIYCDQIENIDACLNYAEKNNLLNEKEILEAKKILLFMKSGDTPGACSSKNECNAYCKDEENLEECVSFAEKSGFISKQEAEIARKVKGKGPGGCSGEECNKYCKEHEQECMDFVKKYGLTIMNREKIKESGEQDKLSITGGVVRDSYSENSLLLNFFKSIKKLFIKV